MAIRRNRIYWVLLIMACVAVRVFSLFPTAVEHYYSLGFYPALSAILRSGLGWIPISVGDLIYAAIIIYLCIAMWRLIKIVFQKKFTKEIALMAAGRLVKIVLWIYLVFNIAWGLNYNRLGIGSQVGLQPVNYNKGELEEVLRQSIYQLQRIDSLNLDLSLKGKRDIFQKSIISYHSIQKEATYLTYQHPSLKPSIFSYLGNYFGFSGYYNPFTGEAQVNTTVPSFLQPFTSTHEIGHQLGYAKEMEANFVGFLVARESPFPAVRYSVYFDLMMYAYSNLLQEDSLSAKSMIQQAPARVKNDLETLKKFYQQYENPFEPIIRALYGKYLEANEQPQGILSYDEVLGWVVAYYRKFGKI